MKTMPTVLLIDDCEEIHQVVGQALTNTCKLTTVATLAAAQEALAKTSFNLILLDVGLPDGDGFTFCATLKADNAHRNTPVLLLTGRTEITDKLTGFAVGAEDYIVKPFNLLELRARVEVRLKRQQERRLDQDFFVKGDLHFDIPTQRVSIGTAESATRLDLTAQEFRLLLLFARSEDQVFSRDQLISDSMGEDVHVLDRTIDTHISHLRKKISQSKYTIRSVRGVGYRLNPRSYVENIIIRPF